ncbi:MAG: DinB family protein [Chloroflexi bacterium]|nr:DinB family protein [Chloroflexota bacterium]
MISKDDFKILFKTWQWIMEVQTEGLSQGDLLIQPRPGGNSMHWVLGHMIESMKNLVLAFGGPKPEEFEKYNRFARFSEPILGEEPDLPNLPTIRSDFATLSDLAVQALEGQDDAYFSEPGSSGTKGETVLFLAFHMSYHAGQLEYLRNLAGRTEKVID